jgi:Tetratricopeptide repeat
MADPTEYDRVATELVELIRQHPHSDEQQIIFDFLSQHLDYLDLPLIDALTKIFRVSPDLELANSYLSLGYRFFAFPSGNRVNNIEIRISTAKLASEVYTKQTDSIMWAAIQLDIAEMYLEISENRSENLELSIEYFNKGLEIYNQQDCQIDWTLVQYRLSFAYLNRIEGDRSVNIELSIEYAKASLETYNKQDFPSEWAWTQNILIAAHKAQIKINPAAYDLVAAELVDLIRQHPSFDDRERVFKFLDRHLAYINLLLLDALAKLFKRSPSVDFADLYLRLGNRLDAFCSDHRVKKLEIVIGVYKLALDVHTKQSSSAKWAMTQFLLACKYSDRIKGGKAENIELSIHHYQNALEIYTKKNFPVEWAQTHTNLNTAYINRIKGYKTEKNIANLTKHKLMAEERLRFLINILKLNAANKNKSQLHELLLQNLPLLDDITIDVLKDWASNKFVKAEKNTQRSTAIKIAILGELMQQFPLGNKAVNMDFSIACYEIVIWVFTVTEDPEIWAMIQNNLATVYLNRTRGNIGENLELSIQFYTSALEIRTKENFPSQWAMTQTNLGLVYTNRIEGNRAENLELSIQCYKSAVEVYTKEDFPIQWADIQNNLANTYLNRIRENRGENLELSIQCCILASETIVEVRNLREQQSRFRNIKNWIARALNHESPINKDDFSILWASIHNNLGNAYSVIL